MSQWIEDKVLECETEIARIDVLMDALRVDRQRAEMARRALVGRPFLKPTQPKVKPRRRKPRKKTPKNNVTAPPPAPKDKEKVRLRVGSTAAREEERRKVKEGERVPVDRVET